MLKIRLRRMGARNAPFYRVVVSDSRQTPTASAVEAVGHYNPRRDPPEVSIDAERVAYWVGRGALLSPTVAKLLRRSPAPAAAAPAAPTPAVGEAAVEAG
jgi:small subunit ribosomal protein S16